MSVSSRSLRFVVHSSASLVEAAPQVDGRRILLHGRSGDCFPDFCASLFYILLAMSLYGQRFSCLEACLGEESDPDRATRRIRSPDRPAGGHFGLAAFHIGWLGQYAHMQ